MSLDQLELLLYDTYRMDSWMPPFYGWWKEDYKKASYSQWAIGELEEFITKRLYPRTSGSIKEFCKLTQEFMEKMAKYSAINPRTRVIFDAAYEMAENILDLLRAMK